MNEREEGKGIKNKEKPDSSDRRNTYKERKIGGENGNR